MVFRDSELIVCLEPLLLRFRRQTMARDLRRFEFVSQDGQYNAIIYSD